VEKGKKILHDWCVRCSPATGANRAGLLNVSVRFITRNMTTKYGNGNTTKICDVIRDTMPTNDPYACENFYCKIWDSSW